MTEKIEMHITSIVLTLLTFLCTIIIFFVETMRSHGISVAMRDAVLAASITAAIFMLAYRHFLGEFLPERLRRPRVRRDFIRALAIFGTVVSTLMYWGYALNYYTSLQQIIDHNIVLDVVLAILVLVAPLAISILCILFVRVRIPHWFRYSLCAFFGAYIMTMFHLSFDYVSFVSDTPTSSHSMLIFFLLYGVASLAVALRFPMESRITEGL